MASRGRGRDTGSRDNGDGDLSKWDPLSDAHKDPNFNSYHDPQSGGVSKPFRQGAVKLFVGSIPLDLTKDGLTNIFCAIGEPPFNVYVCGGNASNVQRGTTFGFVEYNDASHAEKAINMLHQQQPHRLIVNYAREKPQSDNYSHRADSSNQAGNRSNMMERRRAPEHAALNFVSDARDAGFGHSLSPKIPANDFSDTSFERGRDEYFDPNSAGVHRDLDNSIRKRTDAALTPISIQAGSDGRRVSFGRGFHPERVNGDSPRPLMPKSDERAGDQNYQSNVQRQSFATKENPPAPSTVAPVPKCNSCLKTAYFMCSLCKITPYCSKECAERHWSAHSYVCVHIIPYPGVFKFGGSSLQDSEQFGDEPRNELLNHATTNNVAVAGTGSNSELQLEIPIVRTNTSANMNSRFSPQPVSQSRPSVNATEQITRPPPQAPAVAEAPHCVSAQQQLWMTMEVLPEGQFSKVIVKTCQPTELWVQLQVNEGKINKLTRDLNASRDKLTVLTNLPKVDDLCAGIYDGQWYRVQVTSVRSDGEIYVRYIDYGNLEKIKLTDIRSIPNEFTDVPAQAILITLQGDKQQGNLKYPAETLVSMKPVRKLPDGSTLVELPGQEPRPLLAQQPLAPQPLLAPRPPEEIQKIEVVSNDDVPCKKCADLPFGIFTKVVLIDKGTKGYWVSMCKNAKALQELNDNLELKAATFRACQPAIGINVAAQFEGQWYRAEVISIAPLTVHFIDFGNDIVVKANEIKLLPPEFTGFPAQALEIIFQGNAPQNLVAESILSVKPVGPPRDGVINVQIEEEPVQKTPAATQSSYSPQATSQQQVLVAESHGQNTHAAPVATTAPVKPRISDSAPLAATHDVLPEGEFTQVSVTVGAIGSFWANITKNSIELIDKLKGVFMNDFEICGNPQVGDFVCVKFDDLWYRARVLRCGANLTSVHLIDFGNFIDSKPDEVKQLPKEYTTFKAGAIKIQCEGSSRAFDDCADYYAKPLKTTADGTIVAEVRTTALLPDDVFSKVQLLHSEGLDFWVQVAGNKIIADIMNKLNSSTSVVHNACEPKEKDFVLALFDGLWTRAVVLSVNPLRVKYIDYGNEEEITDIGERIRAMPDELATIPTQAVKIHFNKDTPDAVKGLSEFGAEFYIKPIEMGAGDIVMVLGQMGI